MRKLKKKGLKGAKFSIRNEGYNANHFEKNA
jgi:hypothetical protein